MQTTFATKADAIQAGFRPVQRGVDKDVSGPNSFGYAFENAEGERTVDVWFTNDQNKIGQFPSFAVMFPPKS